MTLLEKKEQVTTVLSKIKDPQERFAYVIDLGKRQPPLNPELKVEAHRIQGCLAKLWLVAECRNGKCSFRTDGDSLIVRAIASMLCDFYSGHTPDEILSVDPSFLAGVGITQHLSANRRNALSRVWDRIREFALAHRGPVDSTK